MTTATATKADPFVGSTCDRCGARTMIVATKGEQRLEFCGHHGRHAEFALHESGWTMTLASNA